MRGQLSAEMLILIAVVIAVVAIAASRLITTARNSSDNVGQQGGEISQMANQSLKGKSGDFCTEPTQCLSGSCDNQGAGATYTCNS